MGAEVVREPSLALNSLAPASRRRVFQWASDPRPYPACRILKDQEYNSVG